MTTIIPFIPSNIITPTFLATLDGEEHEIKITWNVSAQRYYIDIYRKNDGVWVITEPLISSPPGRNVSDVYYDPFNNAVFVTLVDPVFWPTPIGGPMMKPGTMVDYTLAGFSPETYNGKFRSMHLNDLTFTFPIDTDPGPVIILGQVHRLLDMAQPAFLRSTLVYRNGAFEINP